MDEETEKELRKLSREISEDLKINFDKIKEIDVQIDSLLRQNNFSNIETEILICLMKDSLMIRAIVGTSSLLSKFKKDLKDFKL